MNDIKTLTTIIPDMITRGNHVLQLPDATLFYRVRGSGPLLLILSGGHGDADTTDALCEQLSNHYTVVTYDRRGLSRSAIKASTGLPTIVTHCDDAHLLLASLTNEPSLVFGSSIGALIGLDLATRHHEQVSVLVAHEPPVWELLPDAERDSAIQSLKDIVDTFHREGAQAAFQKFAIFASVNYTDHEQDVVLAQPTPQTTANMNFFLANDALDVNNYRLDMAALKVTDTNIVAAGGRSSGNSLPHQCTEALATKLGTDVIEFAGSHTGWLLRPKEFAAKLIDVFKDHTLLSKNK